MNNHQSPPELIQAHSKYKVIAKLDWLKRLAGESLTRSELAICCLLADMANPDGIAWPSLSFIGKRIGTSPRGAKKSIKRLLALGIIQIHRQGNRVQSNRYRINIDHQVVNHSSPQGSEPQDTRVVNPSSVCSEPQVQHVVNHSSPESIHQASQEAKMDGLIVLQTDTPAGGSIPASPVSPPLGSVGEYEEFWQALGKRVMVQQSNALLSELIESGVDYRSIVAGASRWTAYNLAMNSKRTATPLSWLQNSKWLDDWTIPEKKSAAAKSKKEWTCETWVAEDARLTNWLMEPLEELTDVHAMEQFKREPHENPKDDIPPRGACRKCYFAIREHGEGRCEPHVCVKGRKLIEEHEKRNKIYETWRKDTNPLEEWVRMADFG